MLISREEICKHFSNLLASLNYEKQTMASGAMRLDESPQDIFTDRFD
jgi:hypothetical protein